MKITTKGLILALKDVGAWLATWQVSGIKADPAVFLYALGIFCFIQIPSDLYLLNTWSNSKASAEAKEKKK